MNSYASLKKQNKGPALAVIALVMCVVLSAAVLFERLAAYTTRDVYHTIPLTQSEGATTVLTGHRDENGEVHFAQTARFAPQAPVMLAYSPFLTAPWFRVTDENTVWAGETEVEIFRVSYENGDGRITVRSDSGSKVIAPGTSNTYKFQLENTGVHAVQYTMEMEAWFTDGTHTVPVNARVYDKYGTYYAGTADTMVDVLELGSVSDSGTLKSGYVMPYTLEWEWPFEGDDAYDTMLGDLAVEEDITLTIAIRTVATYTPEPPSGGDGDPPQTGDTDILLTVAAMLTSGVALLILVPMSRRKGEKNEKA